MNQDTTSIALLEISSGETTDYTEQEINQLPFKIGRSANCQLQLSAPAIWAEHLEIDLNEKKQFVLRRLSKATAMIMECQQMSLPHYATTITSNLVQ